MADTKNVADDSTPPSTAGAEWLKGYAASTPDSADAPTNPSWQDYGAPGEMTKAYKAMWKNRPRAFPNGPGDEGTL